MKQLISNLNERLLPFHIWKLLYVESLSIFCHGSEMDTSLSYFNLFKVKVYFPGTKLTILNVCPENENSNKLTDIDKKSNHHLNMLHRLQLIPPSFRENQLRKYLPFMYLQTLGELKLKRWMLIKRDQLKDQDVGLIADRLDSEMLRGFCDGRTDRRTDRRTFAILESLSRLKIYFCSANKSHIFK